MSVDTYRIDQANGNFHLVWAAPVGVLITLLLLIINLTYSALAGFALIAIAMPLLGRAVRSLLARRSHINRITDQRVSLTQEILQAVRFVKFFGWERAFIDRLGGNSPQGNSRHPVSARAAQSHQRSEHGDAAFCVYGYLHMLFPDTEYHATRQKYSRR